MSELLERSDASNRPWYQAGLAFTGKFLVRGALGAIGGLFVYAIVLLMIIPYLRERYKVKITAAPATGGPIETGTPPRMAALSTVIEGMQDPSGGIRSYGPVPCTFDPHGSSLVVLDEAVSAAIEVDYRSERVTHLMAGGLQGRISSVEAAADHLGGKRIRLSNDVTTPALRVDTTTSDTTAGTTSPAAAKSAMILAWWGGGL